MLRRLSLRDIVLVDEAEIEFGRGFNVLSGETGAGKSILLDALGLALGDRADAGLVREGCPRAEVVAEFELDDEVDAALPAWLAERGLDGDEGLLLLRRTVAADGGSRAFVNNHPATAALLRELGERLVNVHGQHAPQALMKSAGQRTMLDTHGALLPQAAEVGKAWKAWREAAQLLEDATARGRELEVERERLQWEVDELSGLDAAAGEWDELEAEQKRLAHAASLQEGAEGAATVLREADDALAPALERIAAKLRPLAAIDARLAPAIELLEGAAVQADEAAHALSDYASRLELDPQRLEQVDARLAAMYALARKLRVQPQDLPDELDARRQRLSALADAADVERLAARERAARAAYDAVATTLSAARRKAAQALAREVSDGIQGLGMGGGRFEIVVEPGEPGPSGSDRIEFLVAGHAGATPRPLAKIASGGELSRIGLAISVAAASAQPVDTLVFDEADAGVGGAVAELIGRLMRRLGDLRQVLAVTHLPQVAACAHRHFTVSKALEGGRTVSRVNALDDGARVAEVARMLGGVEITDTTRRHAKELLKAH